MKSRISSRAIERMKHARMQRWLEELERRDQLLAEYRADLLRKELDRENKRFLNS